jgi:son of sevenless-like protein
MRAHSAKGGVMVDKAHVPEQYESVFENAEKYVGDLFKEFVHEPQKGMLHIGGERYVMVRGESLFMALFEQLEEVLGVAQAQEFLYNTARVIGKSDSKSFAETRGVTEPIEKLSTGPVLFAYSGWAFVEIYRSSRPRPDEGYFLQYQHPNTFESEIYERKGMTTDVPVCFFSAGYSAGWCSDSFSVSLHAREMTCTAKGDERCEFIMAPYRKLDAYASQYYRK